MKPNSFQENPEIVRNAPFTTVISRMDEAFTLAKLS
jgi:hypothetical protein